MKNFLIIVFCKFYGFLKDDFNAMGLLTVLLSLNVFAVIGYYKVLVDGSRHITLPRVFEILIVGFIGVMNYLYFSKGERYKVIYKMYKENPAISNKKATLITVIYITATLSILLILALVARINHHDN